MAQKKYVSLSKLESFLDNLKNLFATKTEVNAKADSTHSHDDVYYTETEVDEKLATLDDRIVAEDDGTLTTELPETFGGRTADEYALKSDLENVGGGVSSWNDLTDKPFGEEVSEREVLPNQTIDFTNVQFDSGVVAESTGLFNVGDVIEVTWNGKVYSCTAFDIQSLVVAGNAAIVRAGEYTGEPFFIAVENGNLRVYEDVDEVITFSAVVKTETIKTIDLKYIVLTSPNGTKYNLSVSDDGTLSAVAT